MANANALDFDNSPFALGVQVEDAGGLTNTAVLTVTLDVVIDEFADDDPIEPPAEDPGPDDPPVDDSGQDPESEPEVGEFADPAPAAPSELALDRVTLTPSGVPHEDSGVGSSTSSESTSTGGLETDSHTPTDALASDEVNRLALLQERAVWGSLEEVADPDLGEFGSRAGRDRPDDGPASKARRWRFPPVCWPCSHGRAR